VFQISIIEGKNPVGESAAKQNPVSIGGVDASNNIVGLVLGADGSLLLPADAATETTLEAARALLASLDGKDFATQTTLASILAKIITAPATEAKQDTLIAKDFATQATLAEIKNFDGGIATGGSKTTIIDTGKDWETNMFAGHTVKVSVGEKEYLRTVSSNTADTLTMATLPGAAASAIIGTPGTAEVTVTVATEGIGGNEYTAEVVEAPGDDDNLSASLTGLVLTVYLGKTGGVLDNAKNTATLVAAAIDTIPEFTAAMTGSGGVVPVAAAVPFTGGVAVVNVSAGSEYQIMRKTHVQLTGSLIAKETNKAVTVDTDILTDYTATANSNSALMVSTNTAGILKLEVDGVLGSLNSGTALDAGKWYAFDVLMTDGSVYNLQFSVNATMQIKWIGGI